MVLDPAKGERAMLIKSSHGDWGIVKGVWSGFKRPKPPTSRVCSFCIFVFCPSYELVQNIIFYKLSYSYPYLWFSKNVNGNLPYQKKKTRSIVCSRRDCQVYFWRVLKKYLFLKFALKRCINLFWGLFKTFQIPFIKLKTRRFD